MRGSSFEIANRHVLLGVARIMRPAVLQAPSNEIVRSVLHLVEDETDIFADDAEKEQLQAAEESDARHQRRPAGHIGLGKDEIGDDLSYSGQYAEQGQNYSGDDAKAKRRL